MVDSRNRKKAWTVAALVMLALSAGGCATSIADMPLVGLPADAPARPREPGTYPAVHDLPVAREQNALEPTEQAKIEKELVAARDRQAAVGPNGQAAVAPKAKARKPSEAKPQQ